MADGGGECAPVVDDNVSADLAEKLGRRWWRPAIDPQQLRELSANDESLPGILNVALYFAALLASGALAWRAWALSSLWAVPCFWAYGTIYAFSGAFDHEARHRSLFRERWLNELFGHVFAFMTNFEPERWRWTHTLHHAYTLSTREPLDFEIQVDRCVRYASVRTRARARAHERACVLARLVHARCISLPLHTSARACRMRTPAADRAPAALACARHRPSKLAKFVLTFVPFGPLLWVHESYLAETFLNALGVVTPVIRHCVPAHAQARVLRSARLHMLIWASLAGACVVLRSWLPALFFMLPTFYGNTLFALCGLAQHAGLPFDVRDHRLNTRTVILGPVLSFLYCKLEYHQEHHM